MAADYGLRGPEEIGSASKRMSELSMWHWCWALFVGSAYVVGAIFIPDRRKEARAICVVGALLFVAILAREWR